VITITGNRFHPDRQHPIAPPTIATTSPSLITHPTIYDLSD